MKIGCVLLAAGAGKRFGGGKLLHVIDGEPMIARALRLYAALPFAARVCVTRTEAAEIQILAHENGFPVVLLWSNRDGRLAGGAAGGRSARIAATSTGQGTLSVTPATQEAVPGSTVTYTVENASTSVDTLTLSLADLPDGVTAAFGGTVLAPGASTTLTVTVAATVATGTSVSLTISGISQTFAVETVTASLAVVTTLSTGDGPTPTATADFSMTVSPAVQEMVRGGDVVTFTITTTGSGDAAPKLKLKTRGLQRGLKAYFSRTRITAGETATVTIMAHRKTKLRPYAFSIKAASDAVDQFAPVTVILK